MSEELSHHVPKPQMMAYFEDVVKNIVDRVVRLPGICVSLNSTSISESPNAP